MILKNKYKQIGVLGLLLLGGLSSCKKDKENPIITVSSPANHSNIMLGSTLDVQAVFTDDKELAEYHVHMGDQAGEHVHDFHDVEYTKSITGDSYQFSEQINIPEMLSSEVYYLHFELTDAEGKISTERIMLHVGAHDHGHE